MGILLKESNNVAAVGSLMILCPYPVAGNLASGKY
jgi:hypothetical protein